nr:hypothetical protein [Tanacetum cinerariifolium]
LEKKRQFKSLGLKRLKKVRTSQRVESSADIEVNAEVTKDADVQGRLEESQAKGEKITELDAYKDVTLEEVDAKVTKDADVQGRLEESQAKVEEVIEVVTAAKLMTKVVTTATTITAALVSKASAPRRKRGVIIQDPEEAATALEIVQSEVKSKDKGKGILVEEPKPLKRQEQIKHDEAFARELEVELIANINWNDVVDQKGEKEIEEEGSKKNVKVLSKEKQRSKGFMKRLEVKEESEMSLELLRLMRRQQQEVYKPDERVWIHPPL